MAIGGLKRTVWSLMAQPIGEKLLRLVAEERQLYLQKATVTRLSSELEARLGHAVRAGPFAGLRYPSLASSGSALFPKLLGSYEQELQPALEELLQRSYATVLDIGAAEGYYAVGVARRLPAAHVIAYDSNQKARDQLAAMARANGVDDRIEIRGHCSIGDLASLKCEPPVLVISDCEGGEAELIDPQRVPLLRDADLLVELHKVHGKSPLPLLRERFAGTHTITPIPPQPRNPDAWPALSFLSRPERDAVLLERTDELGWVLMTANRSGIH